MKYRRDIHDYIVSQLGDYYKKNTYKPYEQDGVIYGANYPYEEKRKICCYTDYSLLWSEEERIVKEKIVDKFNVKFLSSSDIVCRCGEFTQFSSFYGSYSLRLKCNRYGNTFTVYSG